MLRSHSEQESELLRRDGIDQVFVGEEELAKSMSGHVLARLGAPAAA